MALTDGCIAYWNLNNDGSGNVSLVDSTGNGNTLTNYNGVSLGTGIIGGDAVFNGTNDLLTNSLFSGSYPLSYSAWVKYSGSGPWAGVGTGFPPGFRLLGIDGDIFFQAPDGATANTTGGAYNDGAWHYVVGVADGTNIYLYVDGSLAATTANSSTGTSLPFAIGYGGDFYSPDGSQIDEVGYWNLALSSAEVTALWNNGAGNSYPFTQTPTSTLYYNNAQNDGDWGNLLNWWQNSGFTVQATALPAATNPINLYNQVTQNSQGADQCFCASANFWSANFGAGLTLQASGVVNMQGTSILAGTTTDGVSMHDSSQLAATSVVDGNVTMRDSSRAFGSILGNATIYYDGGNGQYPIGGTVGGSVTYLGWPVISPQWFNDQVTGGADDGDFSNQANWWTDNTFTTRPINAEGYQQLPDASTDVFIAPNKAIYANTGTSNPTINTLVANTAELANISLTVSNGATFSGSEWGMYSATLYGNAIFKSGSYNQYGVIQGTATYESSEGLQGAWNTNSLSNINIAGSYGSSGFAVNISGGGGGTSLGTNWISRLLHLPWFINV